MVFTLCSVVSYNHLLTYRGISVSIRLISWLMLYCNFRITNVYHYTQFWIVIVSFLEYIHWSDSHECTRYCLCRSLCSRPRIACVVACVRRRDQHCGCIVVVDLVVCMVVSVVVLASVRVGVWSGFITSLLYWS